VDGVVSEVVYAGATTRFVVDLAVGGRLVAAQQNQAVSSTDARGMRGAPVRLLWDRANEFRVA
jgi:putative spermidine/putrescine transport system ATP-binding protein